MIGFDADDTLWHNEVLYLTVHERFRRLMARYGDPAEIGRRLDRTEIRNLEHYGYGAKSFGLSLIETAVEVSEGRITGAEIAEILTWTKGMLSARLELLEHAAGTVAWLSARFPLLLITKGDPLDQEGKLARSGLGPHFRHVEVVSDKTRERYALLLARYRVEPRRFMMVGNSLRSDILPVVELQGQAAYIPYHTTWAHEHVDVPPEQRQRFYELAHLGLLPALVERLTGGSPA